jgi:murein DD-endopeptidase MepM/ murein hydrolase activator NlpD
LDYIVFILKDQRYSAIADRHLVVLEQDFFTAKIQKGSSISESIKSNFPYPHLARDIKHLFATIYSWSVDFFRIQPNDYLKVIYTKKIVKGKVVGIERINAAFFNHMNRGYYAFYFPIRQSQDFYDEAGNSLKRFFLSAPIQYTRISSNFSMRRLHPVQKVWKGHFGTDYAAPVGTPIWTTADGVVSEANYTAGNGLYVKVRHNKTYQTQYLHMSKIARNIRPGVRVKQGEIIGYVGSTGLATGPHVCYRFWKDGRQTDPRRERFSATTVLNVSKEPEFLEIKELFIDQLEKISDPL